MSTKTNKLKQLKGIQQKITEGTDLTKTEQLILQKLIKENINEFTSDMLLNPNSYPHSKQKLVDADYTDKLDSKERAWLAKFTNEFVGGTIGAKSPLHSGKKQKKKVYAANNAHNRDLYNKVQIEPLNVQDLVDSFEDDLIVKLDIEKLLGVELATVEELTVEQKQLIKDYLESK